MVDGNTTREMARTLIQRMPLMDPKKLRTVLAQAHVKYILIHHPRGGLYAWQPALPPVTQLRGAFTPVYDGPDMTVLRVYPADGGV